MGKKKINNIDYKFIMGFNKIKLTKLCENLKIDRSNILNGKACDQKLFEVRREIEKEFAKLYFIEEGENDK